MRIQIVSRKLRCTETTKDYICRRVHFALGRFVEAIRGVQVYLSDENGPRGGEDKRCRVLVTLGQGEPLVVESRGENVSDVVDRSMQRASRAISRFFGRKAPRLDMGGNLWPTTAKD